MKTHQGAGDLPGPVRGRRGAVQLAGRDLRLGRVARLRGRADPDLGRPPVRPGAGGRAARTIATWSRARSRRTGSRSPSSARTCRASSSPSIRPMTRASTPSRRPQVRGNPKARQEWAVQQMLLAAKASRHLGLDAHVTFSGRPGLSLSLSLAAAARRA